MKNNFYSIILPLSIHLISILCNHPDIANHSQINDNIDNVLHQISLDDQLSHELHKSFLPISVVL